MGVLGSAGQAAETITGKATKNPVGDALDAVADGLAGKSGGSASGKVVYAQGDPLDRDTLQPTIAAQSQPVGSQPTGGQSANAIKGSRKLQFVHYSFAHDDAADGFPGTNAGHGLAFRAALIREAVLVYSFARGAQAVLQEAAQSKGAAGALLATAGSLLGSDSKQAPAGPEAIDPILNAIRTAGNKINVASIAYPDVHQAGIDLAKAWADLGATCQTALDPSKGGGAGLPSLPIGNLIPAGVPGVITEIPKWLFKAQDAYMAMFREARAAYEWPLVRACHAYSEQAIVENWLPEYDIWFLRNRDEDANDDNDDQSAAETTLEQAQKGLRALPSFTGGGNAANALGDIQQAMANARHQAGDSASDITGWLATAESEQADMPPGSADALAHALAVLKGDPHAKPAIDPLEQVLGRGLAQGLLGKNALPAPLDAVMSYACDITLTLLPKVYSHLHGRYGKPEPALIMAAVHDAIASRIVGLVWKLLFADDKGPGSNDSAKLHQSGRDVVDKLGHGRLGLPAVGADDLKNKAADLVRGFLTQQAHYLDAIVLFVADDLISAISAAYPENNKVGALTMEAYLGRLPQLAALLTRNLIFPVFNLLMQAFGLGNQLAGVAWDPVREKLGDAAELARKARNTKEDVRRAGENVNQAAQQKERQLGEDRDALGRDTDVNNQNYEQRFADKKAQGAKIRDDVASTPGDMVDAAMRKDDNDGNAAPDNPPPGNGPLSQAREIAGEAQPVTLAQLNQAGRVDALPEPQAIDARRG